MMLDLAIVGGGPAGLTAGLYATRGGLEKVVMYEKGLPGGAITQSSEVENYPGIKEVVTGMDLMAPWPEQCMRFGLKHEMREVLRVQKAQEGFTILLDGEESVTAKSVIVCTGGVPRKAGFKGEEEFFGRGVSTCATCDGFFYRDKEVAVIGGGDTALEEALYLAEIASKVYLIHRRSEFRAAPATVKRAEANEKIVFMTDTVVEEVYGDNMGVQGVRLKNRVSGEESELKVPGVFVFVGYDVNNAVLKQEDGTFLCDVNEWGQVVVDLSMRTSVPGLYAAGDIRIEAPKQVVCAAADGATAALQAIEFVRHQG